MSPDTPLFGRMTIGSNRINLGRGGFNLLMVRATEQLQKHRVNDDTVIQIECSRNRLQDSTTFDKMQVVEQQLASQVITDMSAESPFPGITVGRVAEVMMTQEYISFEAICSPDKRLGLTMRDVERIQLAYFQAFPDCAPHFPKWID